VSDVAGKSGPGGNWQVHVGESEGQPLVVLLDHGPGRGFRDPAFPWAVMIELKLARVDGNGLPPQDDWGRLAEIEAVLIRELGEDWRYVVRVYGEGVCRFGFYAPRNGGAEARVRSAMAEAGESESYRAVLVRDAEWAGYAEFFPDQEGGDGRLGGVAPSFRDDTGASSPPPPRRPWVKGVGEEQPFRGEDGQRHLEE
jgi:hypothetical protein